MVAILSRPQCVNPYCAETRIFQDNQVNAMVAYAVALCITMSSGSIVLVMQDRVALVFYKKEFQLPTSSQLEEIIENWNIPR